MIDEDEGGYVVRVGDGTEKKRRGRGFPTRLKHAEMVRPVDNARYKAWAPAVDLGMNLLPDSVSLDSHEEMKYELRRRGGRGTC